MKILFVGGSYDGMKVSHLPNSQVIQMPCRLSEPALVVDNPHVPPVKVVEYDVYERQKYFSQDIRGVDINDSIYALRGMSTNEVFTRLMDCYHENKKSDS